MDRTSTVPRKRHWFQIHLSTAMVLMFVAGLFLWANVPFLRVTKRVGSVDGRYTTYTCVKGGWPFCKVESVTQPKDSVLENSLVDPIFICSNTATGVVLLLIVAFVCESLIRRRARAKATEPKD